MASKKEELHQAVLKPVSPPRQGELVPIRLVHRKKQEDNMGITGMLGQVKDDTESLLKMMEDHIETSALQDEKDKNSLSGE